MLGVKAERSPRQHELCVSLVNAMTNALRQKLRHAENLLLSTERLPKERQDMNYILSLIASAFRYEETRSPLLADPPKSNKFSPDSRKKYTGGKHPDPNIEYKYDYGKRDSGSQREEGLPPARLHTCHGHQDASRRSGPPAPEDYEGGVCASRQDQVPREATQRKEMP